MNKQESQDRTSITINGVNRDAVDIPSDFTCYPCVYCGIQECCPSQGNPIFCDILAIDDDTNNNP